MAAERAQRLRTSLRTHLWPVIDAGVWVVAVYASVWLRYDFRLGLLLTSSTFAAAIGAGAVHVLAGSVIGPYVTRHRRGSAEEIADLARTVAITAVPLLVVPLLVYPPPVPRSTAITAGALALLTMLATRLVVRSRAARRALRRPGRRVLVFGAGDTGSRLVRGLLADAEGDVLPVGLLDDDPGKARFRVEGVRVLGKRSDVAGVVARTEADMLVLAAPSADPAVLREVSDLAAGLGLDVKVAPRVSELVGSSPSARDLRDVDLTDILGRTQVHLDTGLLAEHIAGRRVLVTGAGGSIGSELCRQIDRLAPGRLVLLDRDESGLQATQMSLSGHGLLDSDDIVLADIRDRERLGEVISAVAPDVVFHAAALKHLPLLESYPFEAWQTNVLGTANVLEVCAEHGVGTVVNISTDKAADPTSVLGQSKRIGELLTAHYARTQLGRYVSVRFGNVLGSRGSVLHAFTAQIDRGGPVTVTHPDVERYFMLIPEACQLVLQASAMGGDGEVMVLEMGEQVRIADVARTLIRLSGRSDVQIVFTGLRPGEKLTEDLFGVHEARRATAHPLVDCVTPDPLDPAELAGLTSRRDGDVRAALRSLATRAITRSASPASPPRRPAGGDGQDGPAEDPHVR